MRPWKTYRRWILWGVRRYGITTLLAWLIFRDVGLSVDHALEATGLLVIVLITLDPGDD